jgi:hypothetical protein
MKRLRLHVFHVRSSAEPQEGEEGWRVLEYMSGIGYVSFLAIAIGKPALGLALYLCPRITSLPARIAVLWPLFAIRHRTTGFRHDPTWRPSLRAAPNGRPT